MPVHLRAAGEKFTEIPRPDREHDRQADRAPHGVAAADPVPEAEDAVLVDAELATKSSAVEDGSEVFRHGGLAEFPGHQRRAVSALVMVSTVVKVLER